MAKTITQLDDAGALQNNNFFEVIQGGLSKKTTFQNLVESIPEATVNYKGLMPTHGCKLINGLNFTAPPKMEFDTGVKISGLVLVSAYDLTGTPSLGIFSTNGIHISAIFEAGIKFNKRDDPTLVQVFKKNEYGNVLIYNPNDIAFDFNLKVLQ